MKLIDRIFPHEGTTQRVNTSKDCAPAESKIFLDGFDKYIREAVIFEATAVAHSTSSSKVRPLSAFHCLMPPYPVVWIEGALPNGDRYGSLITVSYATPGKPELMDDPTPERAHYALALRTFIDSTSRSEWPIVAYALGTFLDEEGRFVPVVEERPDSIGKWNAGFSQAEADESIHGSAFIFETLALLNCKNVSTIENPGRWPNRQARRLAERKGLPGPVKFKTLVVKPLAATGTGDGTRKGSHKERAMHICRGHFSTYTPEKPLFGKYHGTFWIPAHVRGNPEVATIAKDYEVKP